MFPSFLKARDENPAALINRLFNRLLAKPDLGTQYYLSLLKAVCTLTLMEPIHRQEKPCNQGVVSAFDNMSPSNLAQPHQGVILIFGTVSPTNSCPQRTLPTDFSRSEHVAVNNLLVK